MSPVHMDALFPPDDHVAQWVFSLSMVIEDLMVLHRPMKESHDRDDVRSMIAVYRQMITRLYEARRLVVAVDRFSDVAAFVGRGNPFMNALRDVYIRPTRNQPSQIERVYEALRHKSVHYPEVGGAEIREVLRQLGHVDARLTARADGELVAEWATMTAALWTLGVQPGSLGWVDDFEPRRAILMRTTTNWMMLWGVALPLYARHRSIELEQIVDLTNLPEDRRPKFQT